MRDHGCVRWREEQGQVRRRQLRRQKWWNGHEQRHWRFDLYEGLSRLISLVDREQQVSSTYAEEALATKQEIPDLTLDVPLRQNASLERDLEDERAIVGAVERELRSDKGALGRFRVGNCVARSPAYSKRVSWRL